jgi:ATP adenylyltransferase
VGGVAEGFCAAVELSDAERDQLLELCIADAYPVSEGHSLVIPRRHEADGLALHQPEWNAVVELPHPIVHKWTSTC